jgi:hypothetical protein
MCDWLHGIRTSGLGLLALAALHGTNGLYHDSCMAGALASLQAGLLHGPGLQSLPMRIVAPLVKQVWASISSLTSCIHAHLRACGTTQCWVSSPSALAREYFLPPWLCTCLPFGTDRCFFHSSKGAPRGTAAQC